jgi:hypothetical protein
MNAFAVNKRPSKRGPNDNGNTQIDAFAVNDEL